MGNDSIPHPDAQFHACRNNFVTYVNGHLPDWALAANAVGAEIRVRAGAPPPSPPPPRWPPQKTESRQEERTKIGRCRHLYLYTYTTPHLMRISQDLGHPSVQCFTRLCEEMR